ncbi:phage portal protein [Fluviibacterium sp. S390]|uniref:phage portal protein n=1 Tax=Fluviibacterium sp. S390 TaxID=3415139 RepID=UPI003C7B245E
MSLSPRTHTRQILRASKRVASKLFRRGVEAGGGGRRWEGGSFLASPAQQTLAARGAAQSRAAAAYINTPFGNRIVEVHCTNMVGKGYQVRSRHPDEDTRRRLGEAFEELVGPALLPMCRALVRDGEAFFRIIVDADGETRLKQVPADQVDPSLSRDLGNGARIVAGVEFDASDQIAAYHVLPEAPGTPFAAYGEAKRIPASDMLHIFDPLFPGQVRGISWLSPVLLKLRDRDEASDAMLMREKVSALTTGYIKDPEGSFGGFEGTETGSALNVSLEPGAMRVLPMGAEVTFSQPGQGLSQAVEFLRAQDREIAAGAGLTFEALTGDLGEANYSSARVGLLEFRRRAEMLQRNLIEGQFLRPLWRRWIDIQALAGAIPADPVSLSDYRDVRFVPPGWQWVDPRNEAEADIAAINAGLKSREEVVAARGRDIDELNAEIERDQIRQA